MLLWVRININSSHVVEDVLPLASYESSYFYTGGEIFTSYIMTIDAFLECFPVIRFEGLYENCFHLFIGSECVGEVEFV